MWRPLGEGAQSRLCAACDVINAYARQHLAGAVTMSALGHERTFLDVRFFQNDVRFAPNSGH
jgi:hypothetical protein